MWILLCNGWDTLFRNNSLLTYPQCIIFLFLDNLSASISKVMIDFIYKIHYNIELCYGIKLLGGVIDETYLAT